MSLLLQHSDVIDWHDPEIAALVDRLKADYPDRIDYIRACFEFVRDEIAHTGDAGHGTITCTASEVLKHQTGYCYAKSHLLAALLRANGFATAFRYQRLYLDGGHRELCLHGYNEVEVQPQRWIRLDARGNNGIINVQFDPSNDCLAYEPAAGECELPERYASPLDVVVDTLARCESVDDFNANVPDFEGSL